MFVEWNGAAKITALYSVTPRVDLRDQEEEEGVMFLTCFNCLDFYLNPKECSLLTLVFR